MAAIAPKEALRTGSWTPLTAFLPYSLSTTELGDREEVERRTSAIADLLLAGLLARS